MLIGSMLDDQATTKRYPATDPFAAWATDDNITGWQAYLGSPDKVGKDDVSKYAGRPHG